MKKKAFITGINGQDGSYLAEFLLSKNYEVHGLIRRSSTDKTLKNISSILDKITLHYGDMIDPVCLYRLISEILPDEVYNLASQSQVGVSFVSPDYTQKVNALGPFILLESIRLFKSSCRFYQASSSELYGHCKDDMYNENSEFHPVSPYAIAKLDAYWSVRYFREAYNMFAVNGILFNHESNRRGYDFVTKKIVRESCEISLGKRKKMFLGNLNARRDWGHSKDYVRAMWLMLQHTDAKDFVIATGESNSVENFVDLTFNELNIKIIWQGEGADRKAFNVETKEEIISVDSKLYRPLDIGNLRGDATLAHEVLNWYPEYDFKKLVASMVKEELSYMGV